MTEVKDTTNDALAKQIQGLTVRLAQLESKCTSADKQPSEEASDVKQDTAQNTASEKKDEPWRVRLITNRKDPNSKTGERKDFEETQAPEPNKIDRQDAATILRLVIYDSKDSGNADEPKSYGELEILNKRLHELLKKLLAHHPTHSFYSQSVKIRSPYEPIIMNWDLLEAEAEKEPENEEDSIARKGLGQLLKLIQQTSGDIQLDDYLKNRESLTKSKSITYDTLWTLFTPGTIVYGRPFLKNDQIFIVQDIYDLWPEPVDKEWLISCWTYDWNGKVFQRKPINLSIPKFRGTKAISSLPYYPLSEAKDVESIKQSLIERGKLYRKLCTVGDDERRFKYNGVAIADKSGFRGRKEKNAIDRYSVFARIIFGIDVDDDDTETGPKELTVLVKSDVMIDFESYYQHGPQQRRIGDMVIGDESDECTCSQCRNNEALAEIYHRDFDEALGTEHWTDLHLHLKGDSSLNGREIKDLLLDLVTTHGQGQIGDLVEDKGKGLVILLYGNPGVGKTSTAETLAAAAGKTLFSIGVGDVGTKAQDVESNLRRIFDLATKWKAILLIDEVDVFVQSRGIGHQGPTTERNALVSVFLRVLEYFSGILILTTNQIALFDVAVQSRIHIAIKYTELDKAQSTAIFIQRLDLYNEKGLVEEYRKIRHFGETDLHKKGFDGRQLRNLVASAMGRAQARDGGAGKMRLEDIETIISNMTSFKGDLEYQTRRYQELQSGRPF
ncbi:P-loop containing nucleoside triphosphate hydrolase protein [Daldinia sp. FL1419]|nr:P-loop containing nucleoside triphosphate hydrolase protein [Daldinia sp. FL1419]